MQGLIIGIGSIGSKHIEASLLTKHKIDWFALRHQRGGLINKNVENVYDYNKIPDIDFVLISNPTNMHFETIKKAIEFNKPIFIEKPVLDKLNNANILKKQISEKKILTYTACNLRFHPVIKWLYKNIHENINFGKIEEVNIYCGSYLPDWRPGRNYKETYSANDSAGGGAHLDLIHELDFSYWIFGMPKTITSGRSSSSHLEITSIDYATYWLNYKSFNVNITLNYFRKDAKRNIEIVTNTGTYFIDILNCKIKKGEQLIYENSNYKIFNTYVDQLEYFIDTLINKNYPSANTFNDGLKVLEIALTKNVWKD